SRSSGPTSTGCARPEMGSTRWSSCGATGSRRWIRSSPRTREPKERTMPIVRINRDPEHCTMTVVAEYDAPPARVWQLYADPRQLERFWGPPTWPATVVDHDLAPGGRVTYFMTGPDGTKSAGYWDVLEVEAPRRFVVDDGFADDSGQPNPN